MERLFDDPATGAFFAAGADAEALIARPANLSDHPTPSDNALAAEALLSLAAYTGDHRYLERAGAVLRRPPAASWTEPRPPPGYLAGVLAISLAPSRELAVVGPPGDPSTPSLLAVAEEAVPPRPVRRPGRRDPGRRRPPAGRPSPAGRPAHGVPVPPLLLRGPYHRPGRAAPRARRRPLVARQWA